MKGWILVAVAVASLAGCAKKTVKPDQSLSPAVELEVVNNLNPPAQVTVFVSSAFSGRQVLGTVSPGRTMRFTYTPTNATDKFAFLAQFASGRWATSPTFTLSNVQTVQWDMTTNMVRFYEQ
ncbi:MAG TPA: hypothetical protein VMT93_05780 [Gemmatimonadaceae bacterium]|nr:hypothetical protein [Gemmatimonadaceae bacterium]